MSRDLTLLQASFSVCFTVLCSIQEWISTDAVFNSSSALWNKETEYLHADGAQGNASQGIFT